MVALIVSAATARTPTTGWTPLALPDDTEIHALTSLNSTRVGKMKEFYTFIKEGKGSCRIHLQNSPQLIFCSAENAFYQTSVYTVRYDSARKRLTVIEADYAGTVNGNKFNSHYDEDDLVEQLESMLVECRSQEGC